jgi:putative alpha-1,2-mannosidase
MFTVIARNNSATNLYIQSARLNGKPLLIPVITYKEITAGGTLTLAMGAKPSMWGSQWRDHRLSEATTH